MNADEDRVQLAYAKFQILKEKLGDDVTTLQGVTIEKLRRSEALRSLILDSDVLHFYANQTPSRSFEKEDETYVDKM